MNFAAFLVAGFSWMAWGCAYATSFGRVESGTIALIDNSPAICLPNDAGEEFSVGWISLSQSYLRNAGSWGIALKPGAKPIKLQPGGCIAFGVVPKGYELDDYKIKTHPLKFEADSTYVFNLIDAARPRDRYTAVFCINSAANGTLEYLQYTRLADGRELIPPCDGRRNGNAAIHLSG